MEVTSIPLVKNLEGPWPALQIRCTGVAELVRLDLYPFLSVTDLKRLLWIYHGGAPRWAPERTFLGVRNAEGLRPIEFSWAILDTLPDPLVQKEPNPSLVDEAGIRKPVMPIMKCTYTIESVVDPTEIIEAISLDDLKSSPVDDRLFGGYYQLYFPWLKAPGQVQESDAKTLAESYGASLPYSEDRTARIGIVNRCLAAGVAGQSASMDSFVRISWVLPLPLSKPESLEKTFYGLQASNTIPFLRYYPAKGLGAPLLKMALNPDGSPIISDPKIFTQYLSQPAPNAKSAVVVARCPLTSEYAPAGTAFTIHLFEDGTSDISLEVPQKGTTFSAAIATESEIILKTVMQSMGYSPEASASLHGIHATYKWIHPTPKKSKPLSAVKLKSRVASLTPFLEIVPQLEGEKALITFQWRATSNYENESVQFQYITQLVLRSPGTPGQKALDSYVSSLQSRFGLTESVARSTLESWLEKRGDTTHSFGASIAIYANHPEYRVEVQGVDSQTELQRLLSVVGVLLGAADSELVLTPPVPAVAAVAAIVALEDAETASVGAPEEEGEGEGEDYGDLLAELGFGGEEEAVGGGGAAAAPAPTEEGPEEIIIDTGAALPDLTAAVAAVEDECGHNPIPAGTVLDIAEDWYMEKLKRNDKTMFGYPASKTGRIKTYSKSCQRRDDRQPNIMTLTEYARVKNCYEEQVRFVDLPPQKPSDLPVDPSFNPKRKYPDEYYLVDPVSKKPMWTVYGYENKSKAGQFLYLICAELWCDYDNLPLLPSEFVGTKGRGFTKPAESCPFCGGRAIKNMGSPKAGESVIVREPKHSTGKIHNFIGTMTRTQHPNGYGLPCCDTTPRLLKHFMTQALSGKLKVVEEEEEYAEVPPEEVEEFEEKITDYRGILHSMNKQYILGNDKTLDAGKIGLLIPILDEFFGQQSSRALTSQGIKAVFADNVTLFVRVGVDTQVQRGRRGMNLFAGLAPLMDMENAGQVMRLFLGQRNPNRVQEADDVLSRRLVRAFEAANYGSLLIEFAAKSSETPSQGILEDFATRNGYTLGPSRGHVLRLYRAWTSFLRYLVDPSQPKQIRHLEHLLAQPGPITPRGLHLIILEQEGESIRIVCPSFGIPIAPVFGDVPISFIWHDVRDDSWEPLVLYTGTKDALRYFGSSTVGLPKPVQASLTQLLRTWRSLQGCARPAPPPHVWTPDRDTTPLPRLANLLHKFNDAVPQAIIRDRSNRLAGVVFSNGCFVPCLDDGFLVEGLTRLYEVPLTPWSVYEKFYIGLNGLRPVALLMRGSQIVGFKTEVGTMIPVMPEAIQDVSLPVDQVDVFPWERDALVLRLPEQTGTVISLEESTASIPEQIEEAYQRIRLTLSKWLNRDARGPNFRRSLGIIIKGGLPLYEKRKRMDLLLQPKIQEWLTEAQADERVSLPILREECMTLNQESCTGPCTWSGGRCLIHVPEQGQNTSMIFTARISDELLRYAQQRREILDDGVQTIRTPKGSVRVGNELYLATKPKETPEDILERLGILGPQATAFPEELLRFEGAEDVIDLIDESILGPDWIHKGFSLPAVADDLEDARGLLFAGVTGKSLEEWKELLDKKRGLPKEIDWSPSDIQLIADVMQSNLLFVRGPAKIEAWYQPAPGKFKAPQTFYSIFWGPRQLLLSKGKDYRFIMSALPTSLLTSFDSAEPISASSVPLVPETPLVPLAPLVPETPLVPLVPLVPEAPLVPETPLVPLVPLVPEAPLAPETPLVPLVPEVLEDQETKEVQEAPEVLGTTEAPVVPEVLEDQEVKEAPEVLEDQEAKEDQEAPEVLEAPMVPETPEVLEDQETAPEVLEDQEVKEAPEVPVEAKPETTIAGVVSDIITALVYEPARIPGLSKEPEKKSESKELDLGLDEEVGDTVLEG